MLSFSLLIVNGNIILYLNKTNNHAMCYLIYNTNIKLKYLAELSTVLYATTCAFIVNGCHDMLPVYENNIVNTTI